jgi:hypothetical protein
MSAALLPKAYKKCDFFDHFEAQGATQMDVSLLSTTLNTTKSNQDMTAESIFELLRADYLNNSNVDDATNYKFIVSLTQPSNINKFKRLFDEINDPGYGLYII